MVDKLKGWAARARGVKAELLALYLAVRFVPAPVLAECRGRAQERLAMHAGSSWLLIVGIWAALAAAGVAFYI